MKKIKIYVLALILFVTTAGCNDFLTEKPKTSLSKVQIFSSDEMAYVGLIGCYRKLSHDDYHNLPFVNVIFSSAVFGTTGLNILGNLGDAYMPVITLAQYQQIPTTTPVSQLFSGIYHLVFTCNDFIANVEESPLSEEAKRRYIGEARFLRAVGYFDLVRIWGKGQLWTGRTLKYQDASRPFTAADKIFEQIIEDFIYAYHNMPTKEGGAGRMKQLDGFPVNMAAYAWLAKVYAQMATSEHMFLSKDGSSFSPYKAADVADFWEKSYRYADTVYRSGVYDLVDDYAQLWQCRTNNTVESIHEINYNFSAGAYWNARCVPINSVYTPVNQYSSNDNNYRYFRPSTVSYRWHNKKYGIDANFGVNTPNKDRDPRIGENYIVDGYRRNDLGIAGGGAATIRCYPGLGGNANTGATGERMPVSPKYCDPIWITNNTSRMSFIKYRYADLILVLAEAANETGRPVSEVVGYVNRILDRARASSVIAPDGYVYKFGDQVQPEAWQESDFGGDRDKLRLELFKERLFELPFEGHEWFDVRRRGVEWFRDITTMYNNDRITYSILNVDYTMTDGNLTNDRRMLVPNENTATVDHSRKQLFMPVPQDELNTNTMLTQEDQNYGY